jgi:hypothetical protein
MWTRLLLCAAALVAAHGALAAPRPPAMALALDTSEADQALRILDDEAAGRTPGPDAWRALFATTPYRWLKARETGMGRALEDADVQRYLASPTAIAQRGAWRQALARMKAADMPALGTGVLAWLPPGATLKARVFPVIKPAGNSFVWTSPGEGPAIFLAIKPVTQAQFENTVAHELHHIGLESLQARQDAIVADQPERVRLAVKWMGAFGEGEAMLAAAGSVDRHPHWEDDAVTRARWDGDLMRFNSDLAAIQALLGDILDGRLATDAEIRKRATPFWGDVQGAWYTVGYEMAALVERRFGRRAFDECLLDPRKLLALYNQVAAEADAKGATLATWSPDLLARLGATSGATPPAKP